MRVETSSTYIKLQRMLTLIQQTDANGKPIPFSMTFVKKGTGEIEHFDSCWLTSRHSNGGTINVMPEGHNNPRKIRLCLITQFNGLTVYM